jgi:predicted SprT family Zn-dependent metalloprotease
MKSTDPTNAQFAAYRAMWDWFNRVLFAGTLGHVILNFSRSARSLGFFAPERWQNAGNQFTHEISLNPTYLTRENAKDSASTLVHEMAHLWRHEQSNPPRNGYHDKQWADKMESLGLMPSDTGKPGGRRTGYRMDHYIMPGGAFERAFESMPASCQLPWTCGVDEDATKGKGKKAKEKAAAKEKEKDRKRKRKYSCPGCQLNVWGKAGLNLRCNDCYEALIVEGGEVAEGVDGTEVAQERTATRKAA